MSAFEVSVSAATAVLDYDLFQNQTWKTSSRNRVLRGAAVKGSAAGGDTKVSIRVGQVEVAALYNNATGFPNRDDIISLGVPVPAGMPISAIVADAPTTNPINVLVDLVP